MPRKKISPATEPTENASISSSSSDLLPGASGPASSEPTPKTASAAAKPRVRTKKVAEPPVKALELEQPTQASEMKKPKSSSKAKVADGPVEDAAVTTPKKPSRSRSKLTPPVSADEIDVSPLANPFSIEGQEEFTFSVLEWRSATPRGHSESNSPSANAGRPGEGEPIAPKRSRRRGRGSDRENPEAVAAPAAPRAEYVDDGLGEINLEDIDLSFTFRTKEGAPTRGRRAPQSAPKADAQTLAPVEPVVAAPVVPPLPVIPVRPSIPTPADAPQIVTINGTPTLVHNLKAFPPLMFFGNSADERRAATVQEEIRLAAEAGIHLHVHFIDLEVNEDSVDSVAAFAAYLLVETLKTDPQARVLYRVVFGPDRNWESQFPNAVYRAVDGAKTDPSVCDDSFWEIAERCLATFVKKLRLLPNADHIYGIHLDRAEWFIPADRGYDTSPAARLKFRDWARTRYSNDEVTLRAAWFDGRVRFSNIEIPEFEHEAGDDEKFVRSSRKKRVYVDYHLFLGDVTASRIAQLAYAVKEASEGYFLVGVSYGYTFEWSHPASGHLALGKLLRTEEVDFIGGPPSYPEREPGGSAPFPCPIDSLTLNGKLYISEEDYKTSLGSGQEPDDYNPKITTPMALESVQWRGAGVALAHGSGLCWMDLWGNGWLKTAGAWQRAKAMRTALAQRIGTPLKDPDVIVFIDERALAYLVDSNAFTALVQNVRESVLRSGLSAGFYLLSDLAHREKFPDAKLYLFLNAWDVRPELRSAIKTRLQRDGKVLFWLYSAGLFDGGRESLERAREVTGIALKPQPFHSKSGTTLLNKRHPLSTVFADRGGAIAGTKLEPTYFAIPEAATVLGEYTQTGLPSFVVREFPGEGADSSWTSVFLGEPIVSPALIRSLGQMAGAHVYGFQDDVVHVNPPFLTVHCHSAGPRTITLPPNWCAHNIQTNQPAVVEGNAIRLTAQVGSSFSFLVGPQEEIEALLSQPIDQLLELAELPEQSANTRRDDANFEVPIMRLGEWMEGGDSEEAAEDWLLRPTFTETEAPQPEADSDSDPRNSRRRRRRRGGRTGGDRQGTEEVVFGGRPVEGEPDFQINVTFRKRE